MHLDLGCWRIYKGQGRSLKSTGPPSPASASSRLMMTAMAASSLLGLLEPCSVSIMSMPMWEFSPAGESTAQLRGHRRGTGALLPGTDSATPHTQHCSNTRATARCLSRRKEACKPLASTTLALSKGIYRTGCQVPLWAHSAWLGLCASAGKSRLLLKPTLLLQCLCVCKE